MITSMIDKLSITATPPVYCDKITARKSQNINKSGYEYTVSSLSEQASYVLEISSRFYIFKTIEEENRFRGVTNSPEVNKYLKFKTISFVDEDVMDEYKISPSLLLNEQQKPVSQIFLMSDFIPSRSEDKFYVLSKNNLPTSRTSKDFFGILYFTYYDLSAISKDFLIDFSDVEGIEQYFLGNVNSKIIMKDGKLVDEENIINLFSLEELKEIAPIKSSAVGPATYFSELYITRDILLKNVGEPCLDE